MREQTGNVYIQGTADLAGTGTGFGDGISKGADEIGIEGA